jgi:hypothetical protein
MMKSSLTNNENSTDLPFPLVRVEMNMGYSPSPQPSPTRGEEDNWDYFLSKTDKSALRVSSR